MYLYLKHCQQLGHIVVGHDISHHKVEVAMKDGKLKEFRYFGYITQNQARWIGERNVKVKASGLCEDEYGNGFEEITEGWFVLGRLVQGGVCVVTGERDKPITFFAPTNAGL